MIFNETYLINIEYFKYYYKQSSFETFICNNAIIHKIMYDNK